MCVLIRIGSFVQTVNAEHHEVLSSIPIGGAPNNCRLLVTSKYYAVGITITFEEEFWLFVRETLLHHIDLNAAQFIESFADDKMLLNDNKLFL